MATITLAQVKQFTTLTAADDASISAMIPIIDSKVRLLTRNRWNYQVYALLESGQTDAEVSGMVNYAGVSVISGNSGINAPWTIDDIVDFIDVGMQLTGTGVPAGTYIEEIYYNGSEHDGRIIPIITMSEPATVSGLEAVQLGIPLAYVPTIAKGVQWLIEQSSKSSSSEQGGIQSKRMGPVSVTYSDADSAIDGLTGMPAWFTKGLPRFHGGH